MNLTKKNLVLFILLLTSLFLTGCGYNLRGKSPISLELFPIVVKGSTPDFILYDNKYVWVQKILQEDLQKLNLIYKKTSKNQTQLFFETQILTREKLVETYLENTSILTLKVIVSAKNKFNKLIWNKLEFSSKAKYVRPSEALNLQKSEQQIIHKLALDIADQIKLRLTKFEAE